MNVKRIQVGGCYEGAEHTHRVVLAILPKTMTTVEMVRFHDSDLHDNSRETQSMTDFAAWAERDMDYTAQPREGPHKRNAAKVSCPKAAPKQVA